MLNVDKSGVYTNSIIIDNVQFFSFLHDPSQLPPEWQDEGAYPALSHASLEDPNEIHETYSDEVGAASYLDPNLMVGQSDIDPDRMPQILEPAWEDQLSESFQQGLELAQDHAQMYPTAPVIEMTAVSGPVILDPRNVVSSVVISPVATIAPVPLPNSEMGSVIPEDCLQWANAPEFVPRSCVPIVSVHPNGGTGAENDDDDNISPEDQDEQRAENDISPNLTNGPSAPSNSETVRQDPPEFVPGQRFSTMSMASASLKANTVNKSCNPPATSSSSNTSPAPKTWAHVVNAEAMAQMTIAEASAQLCPFGVVGECRYGDMCAYVHGEICDLCQKAALHPTHQEQRRQHQYVRYFTFFTWIFSPTFELITFNFIYTVVRNQKETVQSQLPRMLTKLHKAQKLWIGVL